MRRNVRQHGAMAGDERLVSLHHTRSSSTRTMRRMAIVVSVVSIVIAALLVPAGIGSARSLIGRPLAKQPGSSGDSDLVWNANAGEAALAACIAPTDNPLHESHMYAMTHLAIHDALNAIDRRYRPYAFFGHASRQASTDAAVATAARDVLVPVLGQIPAPFPQACIDAAIAGVEADYAAALDAIADTPSKRKGVNVGAKAAAAILALRADDGSDTPLLDFEYPQGTEPGEYRFTPGIPFAFAPGWQDVTPFVLEDSSQFRADPPYDVTDDAYTADFDEVKRLGGDGITTPSERTPDETEIALFWVESSPLQWNRIGRIVSADEGLDLWEQARLFGLLKHGPRRRLCRLVRDQVPVQLLASRHGDPDRGHRWQPGHRRRPDMDPIGHNASDPGPRLGAQRRRRCGGAGLPTVLRTDEIGFETCSLTLPAGSRCNDASAVTRSFTSFSQAADENAVSRILVGFHFRKAVEDGVDHGRLIGNRAVDLFLLPVH